jgi:hypothetical protein
MTFALASGVCYTKGIGGKPIMNKFTVFMDRDEESQKWYAHNDDIPIMLEDASLDTLINRVKLAAPEMLALNGQSSHDVHLTFKMESQAVVA